MRTLVFFPGKHQTRGGTQGVHCGGVERVIAGGHEAQLLHNGARGAVVAHAPAHAARGKLKEKAG